MRLVCYFETEKGEATASWDGGVMNIHWSSGRISTLQIDEHRWRIFSNQQELKLIILEEAA